MSEDTKKPRPLYQTDETLRVDVDLNTGAVAQNIANIGINTTKGNTNANNIALNVTDIGGKISDAPVDGNEYSRKDGLWAIATGGVGGTGDMTKAVYDTTDNGKVDNSDNSDKVNNLTVETAVPINAKFTDTVYSDTAIQNEVNVNSAKTSNIAHPLVEKAVPINAVFTDTNTIYDDSLVLKDSDTVSPVTGVNKIITQSDMTGGGDMSKTTYDTNNNGIVDNSEKVNNLTVEKAVPSNAVFTDTIYNDTAIQSEVDLNTGKISNISHPLVNVIVPVGAVFTDTIYNDSTIQAEVDLNTAKVSNVSHALVETAVPVGAVFTDTAYDDTNTLVDSDTVSPVTGINKIMTQDDVTGLGALPSGGTVNQVLTKNSSTDFDTGWADGGTGGSITTVPIEYCRSKVSTNQVLNTTGNTDMVFATADVNSDSLKFTVVSGGIKVLQTGRYNIKLHHTIISQTVQRADPIMELLVNGTGTGYLTREHYARASGEVDYSTATLELILDVTANDIIGLRLTRGGIDLSTTVITQSTSSWIEVTEHHGVKGDKGDIGATGNDGVDGGISDAPNDGNIYGRISANWSTAIATSTGFIGVEVVTQSVYTGLGTTPNTNNIMYIIRN